MKYLYFLLLLLVGWLGVCAGSKVLIVFPVPGRSHGILGESIVRILLDAGHEVTYVSPFPPESNATRLRYVNISSMTSVLSGQPQLNIAELSRAPHPVHHTLHVGPMFAQKTLEHPEMQSLLHDSEVTFDVVLVEWFFTGLLAPLAEVYNCPLIWYRSSDICWQSLRMMHEATSPTYSTDLQVSESPVAPFSTRDRLYQSWLQLYLTGWMYLIRNRVEIPAYETLYREPLRKRGKFLPDYDSLVYNASLMFSNSHPPLGQKLPLPLNVKYLGGHHIEQTIQPLPKDLKNIMDDSKNGVIFFSMGSMLKGKDLPSHMRRPLIQYFAQLKQTVIWKYEEKIDGLPKNVHVVEWAPQQSILSHPNTILFITHGGILSILEATHFGVPLIGIPIFGDQFSNVDFAVGRGVAIRIDFLDDFPQKLAEAIDNVLENDSYITNAETNSIIFRHRLASPQQELNHWIQLVTETKGALHLRSPALQVSTLDRLYLDFIFLCVLILWFLTKVVKVIKVHLDSNDDLEKKNA